LIIILSSDCGFVQYVHQLTLTIFTLDVSLTELSDSYLFVIEYTLNSNYIKNLLNTNKAKLYLVIESKDHKHYELGDLEVSIPKSRIALDKRTQLQLFIVNTKRISFRDNDDIDGFYGAYKKDIFIDKYSTIALSNIEAFDGEMKKPYDLFLWSVDEKLKTEFNVKLKGEFIHLTFKDKELHYIQLAKKYRHLNNHFVYIGLQYAFFQLYYELVDEEGETLRIDEISEPIANPLYQKLIDILIEKKIKELEPELIGDVIGKISDNIFTKQSSIIKEVLSYET